MPFGMTFMPNELFLTLLLFIVPFMQVEAFKNNQVEDEIAAHSLIGYLRSLLIQRQKNNPNYSISSFARDLGVSQPQLSRIFNGERKPTVRFAVQVGTLYSLPKNTIDRWVGQVVLEAPSSAKISKKVRESYLRSQQDQQILVTHYEVERFKSMAQWYHMAIVNLTFTKDFKDDPRWISKRLNITVTEARDATDRLYSLGILTKERNGRVIATQKKFFVKTQQSEPSVREFHRQMATLAIESLKNTDQESFEQRYITGLTLAVQKNKLPEFKQELQEFQKKIMAMVDSKTFDEVYQLNLQFFPLTQKNKDTIK